MPLQPDIALSGQPNFPTAQSLLNVSQGIEQMQDRKRLQQMAQQVQQYFAQHTDAIDPTTGITTPKAIMELSQISPEYSQAAQAKRMQQMGQTADIAAEEQETAFKKYQMGSGLINQGLERAYAKGSDLEGDGANRDKAAAEDWQDYLNEIEKNGMAAKAGLDLPKLRAGAPKWDTIPFRLMSLKEKTEAYQRRATQQRENEGEPQQQGVPLSGIADVNPEQQDTQTATKSGALYRGAPAGNVQGVPLAEVGKTPQQEAATAEQGPSLGEQVQAGSPTTTQNIEDTSPVDEWMNRARELEKAAERIRKDPKTGETGQKRSQELRKDANELRTQARAMMKEDRAEEELGLKQKRLEMQIARQAATQSPLSQEAVDFAVNQYLDGNPSAITGLARNQTAQSQIKNRIPQLAAGRGMKPADVNAKQLQYHGMMQEQRSLGTRAANVALPINELKTFIPLAEKASDAVPRTNFVPINRILQLSRNQWSPEQSAFVAANRSIINAFAQLASRGVPTVHSTTEAEAMLNTAQTPAQYKAVLRQLWREADAARRAVTMSREDARQEAVGESVGEQPYPGDSGKVKTPSMGTKSKPAELLKPYSDPEEEKAYQEYKKRKQGG